MEEKLDLLLHKIQPLVEQLKSQHFVPEDEIKFITIPEFDNPSLADKFVICNRYSMAYTYFFVKYKLFDKKQELIDMVTFNILPLVGDLSPELIFELQNRQIEYNDIFREFSIKYNIMTRNY
jgi:hypothetical protein